MEVGVLAMDKTSEFLFRLFEEKMMSLCGVVPSDHSKTIVPEKWFRYVDSLGPHVESVRPTRDWKEEMLPRKKGNFPLVELLLRRVNEGDFDKIVIEDPGISSDHVPGWGPNLLLVDRQFALKVYALGELP